MKTFATIVIAFTVFSASVNSASASEMTLFETAQGKDRVSDVVLESLSVAPIAKFFLR